MTERLLRRFIKNYDNTKDAGVRAACGRFAGLAGIVCNIILVAFKLTAGLISGSIAIIADALNNLSDAAASVITLAGFKFASKTPDKEHPFGHARFEYIAGLTVAVMVIVMGIELGKTSIEKIIHAEPAVFGYLTFAILAGSVLLKLWMAYFYSSIGLRINSSSLKAASIDSRNDVIATFAVLVSAIIARFSGINLDGWMGLGVAIFILISGIRLVKDTMNPLLGEAPESEFVKYVADKITSYEGILGTHDLIVHDYGCGSRFASVHVEMCSSISPLKSHEIIDNIERSFLINDNIHLIIHCDPIITDEHAGNTRIFIEKCVKTIDERLSIHDLRISEDENRIDYVFDILAPPEFDMTEEILCTRIEQMIKKDGKAASVRLTVDYSYAAAPKKRF